MQHWLAFPFLRYVLWLIAGILLAFAFPGYAIPAIYMAGVTLLILLVLLVFFQRRQELGLLKGVMALLVVAGIGYWRTQDTTQAEEAPPGQREAIYWWVAPVQEPVPTAKSYRFEAEVWPAEVQPDGFLSAEKAITEVELPAEKKKASVNVLVYVPKSVGQSLPSAGERVLVKGELRKVGSPLNPHEFDYQAYLATKGIHHQLYARGWVKFPGDNTLSWLQATAYQSRAYLLLQLKHFMPSAEVAAVVSAMVLGQRSELDRALQQAYSSAGVMHVLAVSGLHVGMVAALFFLLFSHIGRQTWRRVLWLLLVLLVLWCYAWLTGLSPSALRASVMFSMIAIGKAVKRKGNVYNSIALSAFLLLLFNPLLILQVGFQLSYLAVTGIVYLQPRISRWFQPAQGWKKKLWELLSVTLAAQLATFPLGLYYFHQFPTYFFIGNLLAVPLAGLIMYSTLAFLALHWVPGLSVMLAWVAGSFTQLLNVWVRVTEALPSSQLVATISGWQTICLYGGIVGILILLRRRTLGWAIASILCLGAVAVGSLQRSYTQKQQQALVIYQIPGHTLLHFIKGKQELLLPLGDAPAEQQLNYHIAPARLHWGLSTSLAANQLPSDFKVQEFAAAGYRLLVWQGQRIAVIEKALYGALPSEPVAVDLVLLRKSPRMPLENIAARFYFKMLVADASNGLRYRQRLKSAADSLNLPIYITSNSGAYYLQP